MRDLFNRFINYVNNFALWKKIVVLVTTLWFVAFHYLLNMLPETISDIFGYAFVAYLLVVSILSILRREWFMLIIHICALLTALFSIFWFLFV